MPFCENNFDFQILIKTEAGNQYAYCGYQASGDAIPARQRNFIATHWDGYNSGSQTFDGAWQKTSTEHDQYVFSSGEIFNKIEHMQSCSFVDGQYGESGVSNTTLHGTAGNSDDLFKNANSVRNIGITATLSGDDFYNDRGGGATDNEARQTSTGSISFKQVSGATDPVKEIKFWGQKVCDVIGVPENVWISMDAVHVDASANKHSFRGDIVGSNLVVHNRFSIPQAGDIGGGLPFKIHYNTSDKLIRFIDSQDSSHTNEILIGYARDVHHGYGAYPDTLNNQYRISTRGSIGAGTLAPAYPLHVSASWHSSEVAEKGIGAIFEQGNVGIGTLTPHTPLHVNGHTKAEPAIVAGHASANGNTFFAGNYNTNDQRDYINTLGNLYSSADWCIGYGIKPHTSINDRFISSMDNGALKRGALTMGGDLRFYNAGSSTTTRNAEVAMIPRFVISENGDVGIGTTSPDAPLEVHFSTYTSSIKIDYDSSAVNGITIQGAEDGGGWARAYNFSTPTNRWGGFGGYGGQGTFIRWYIGKAWDDAAINILSSSKYVGIGTATPKNPLQIKNTTAYTLGEDDYSTDSIALYGSVGSAQGSYYGGITWHNDSRRRAGISSVMDGTDADYVGIAFHTQGADGAGDMHESMRITRGGNVGIGIKNPTAELHISASDETAAIHIGEEPFFAIAEDTDRIRLQLAGNGYTTKRIQIGRDDGNHNVHLTGKIGIGKDITTPQANGLHIDQIETIGSTNTVATAKQRASLLIHDSDTNFTAMDANEYSQYGDDLYISCFGSSATNGNIYLRNSHNGGGVTTVMTIHGDTHTTDFGYDVDIAGELYIGDQAKLSADSHRAGLIRIEDVSSSPDYAGFQVVGSSGKLWAFMAKDVAGIYNDDDSQWGLICRDNAETELYYQGGLKLETKSDGVKIIGECSASSYIGDGSGLTGVTAGTNLDGSADVIAVTGNYNFGIGTSSPANVKLHVKAHASNGSDIPMMIERNNTNNDSIWFRGGTNSNMHTFVDDGTNTGSSGGNGFHWYMGDGGIGTAFKLTSNGVGQFTGDVIAYSTSDKRLKKNIIKIDNALSKISQLNGVTFEWKDKEEHPEKYHNIREAGIIAQDVVKVLPEAVKTREHNGYMAVKYEQLIPLLIEGIKEQQEQIDELKAEVKKLKGDN